MSHAHAGLAKHHKPNEYVRMLRCMTFLIAVAVVVVVSVGVENKSC